MKYGSIPYASCDVKFAGGGTLTKENGKTAVSRRLDFHVCADRR